MLPNKYLTNTVGGLLVGFAAGVISASVCMLFQLGFFLPGPIFGMAVSAYCWLFYSRRSVLRDLIFIAICIVIEAAMVLLAFGIVASNHSDPVWIFHLNSGFVWSIVGSIVAGTIGAFLVLIAVLLLFFTSRGFPRIFFTALYWAPFGGILSALGWVCGVLIPMHLKRWETVSIGLPFQAVFFAWQTGLGLMLGVILHKREQSEFAQ